MVSADYQKLPDEMRRVRSVQVIRPFSFDPLRFAASAPLVLLVQKALTRTLFRIWVDCAAHVLVLVLLVCVAGNGRAETAVDSTCPAGDLSAAEYLRLSAGDRKEKIEAYRQAYRPAMETVVHRLRQLFAGKPVKIQFRLKTIESIQEKLIRKGYRCFSQMTDIAGVRALILDFAAIPFVSHTVQAHFPVFEKQDLIDDPHGTGYRAVHYLLAASGRIVELQIHTMRGTIWALLSQNLVYKGPYGSNESVGGYLEALSRVLFLLDSGFERQSLPLPTNLPPMAQHEIKGGLMLIQAYDAERVCSQMGETLGNLQKSGLALGGTDYYGLDEFNLSYEDVRFAEAMRLR